MGARVDFDLAGDIASGCRLVETAGFECRKDFVEQPAGTIMLVDRVHGAALRQLDALVADIVRWRGQGAPVAVIDGIGENSLRHQRPGLKVDLFIAPYAGERSDKNQLVRLLAGPEFAPLGADYEKLPPRPIQTAANRILVSCGGSDPFEITAMVMKALATFKDGSLPSGWCWGRASSVRIVRA